MNSKNKIQRNFKKQMQEIEKKSINEEKKNKGIFSNKLFKLKFYGDNYSPTTRQVPALKILKFIIELIYYTVKLLIFILTIIVIIQAILILTNNYKVGNNIQNRSSNYIENH